MPLQHSRRAFTERAYAMKKHRATRLHYDLRLEWNGVLLSWALPDGPSCSPGVLREAIEMDDHNKEYLQFEGVHRTGPIMLWDRGTWAPHAACMDISSCLLRGILRFTLRGEKLEGAWALTRMHTMKHTLRPIWMLSKDNDAFAERYLARSILEEQPNSITGKTMEEIVQNWTRPKDRHARQMSLFNV